MLRLLALLCLLIAPSVGAQTSPILVVDQDRMFADSAYGLRILDEIQTRTDELAAESRQIEADLVAEEQRLTELRKTMDPVEFRALADEFDGRVQALRIEQDTKVRDFAEFRDTARQDFFARIGPILSDLVGQRGGSVLLDSRVVLLNDEAADITDAAIALIDQTLGDGTDPARDRAVDP